MIETERIRMKAAEWLEVVRRWLDIAREWMSDPERRYATLAGAALFVSLMCFIVFMAGHSERVFFYPRVEGKGISTETRTLPRRGGTEKELEYYVRELILGSVKLSNARLLPVDTRVNAVLVRHGIAYIDISSDLVLVDNPKLDFADTLGLVEKSVRFNFPYLRKVVLTLDGNQPQRPGRAVAPPKKK